MSTNSEKISVSNFEVDVVRKKIKNMHLGVYPPNGRIRLAVPENTNNEAIRLFLISKLGWLKKHVNNFKEQERETERTYVSGESHYFFGKRYLLEVIEHNGYGKVVLSGNKTMKLYIKPEASREDRAKVVKEWYRKQLKKEIPELLEKWGKETGLKPDAWGVKIMRTKWGTCNTDTKRIWINLELAKKPKICLEYIIVHELVHLLERNHTEKFIAYMDKFMPKWRQHRDTLNSLPIVHQDWEH